MCFGIALSPAYASAASAPVELRGSVTIVLKENAPVPLRHACEDLISDFTKVLGQAPHLVHDLNQVNGPAVVVSLPGETGAASTTAPESFSMEVHPVRTAHHRRANVIQLAGADLRGTMYAIYEFSDRYLGVDPMYYWTDNEPARRDVVRIPATLREEFPAPVFRYRGFFVNDEDLLTGWAPGEATDHTGISLAVWNKIFETVLRLKGNMVGAGTWPFSDDAQNRLLSERGLLLSQHHAEPLGANFSRWPEGVPYNYTAHPRFIQNAWKHAVEGYGSNRDILWSVGLRGLSDQAYSALDPSVRGNPQAEGRVISQAIADQIKIVRAKDPNARFVTDLWQEGAKLMQQGVLQLPPGVTTIWADTGYGDMQDGGRVKAGQGAYIHVAMMNFAANQLSEMVPTERLFSQLERYQRAGATSFLLVNTSDIRPVTMNARAAMEVGWKGEAVGSADQYYTTWSTLEYGSAVAPKMAKLYRDYFAAPAVNRTPERTDGDMYYQVQARQMLLSSMLNWSVFMIPDQKPNWMEPHTIRGSTQPEFALKSAELEIPRLGAAQLRWDAVWDEAISARRSVEPARLSFYDASVLTMIAINREGNHMLLALAEGIVALHAGNRALAVRKVEEALQASEAIQQQENKAEYGKWKNWYHGDWLTSCDSTRQMLQVFAAWVRDPASPILPPITWDFWKAYFYIQHYQGSRTLDVSDAGKQ